MLHVERQPRKARLHLFRALGALALLFSLPHAGGQQPVSQDLLHVNP
jgi:hypothetical protein